MPSDADRAQLIERNRKVRESLKNWKPGPLDPEKKLPFVDSKFPGRRGLSVLSAPSLAYLLFESGGNTDLACDIIESSLRYQDLRDPKSPTYGNFFWYTHWTEVEDPNAVSFMAPWYARIWREHRAKLRPATARLLEERFPLILNGLMKQPWLGWNYTNIFLLTTAGRLQLARIVDDDAALAETTRQWEEWIDKTAAQGIPEFNSPTYAWVDLLSLLDMREGAPNETFHREVERALEYFILELFLHYHEKTGQLTGAFSRAYRVEETGGLRIDGGMPLFLYHQLGAPESGARWVYELAHSDYLAPDWIRDLARRKSYPLTIHASAGFEEAHWVRSNFMHRKFAVGSFSNSFYSILQIPVFAAFESAGDPRYVLVRGEPELATCYSDQLENAVLAAFCYNFHDKRHRYGDVGFENRTAKVVLRLGSAESVREVLVAGKPWDGAEVALAPYTRVAFKAGPAAVGVVALVGHVKLDGPGMATSSKPVVLVRDDRETRLEIHAYRGDEIAEKASPFEQAGFYLVVEESDDLAAFDARLARVEVETSLGKDAWKLSVSDGTRTLGVMAPVSAEAVFPDRLKVGRNHPSPEYLLRSPVVDLRVGEFADIARGKAEWRRKQV